MDDQGQLTGIAAETHPRSRDTLVHGRRFSEAHPAGEQYALEAGWQVRNDPFTYFGVCYLKYGRPRTVEAAALVRVGEHRGVSLFREADDTGERPAVIYVPLRPGCVFQAYQYELVARPCERDGQP